MSPEEALKALIAAVRYLTQKVKEQQATSKNVPVPIQHGAKVLSDRLEDYVGAKMSLINMAEEAAMEALRETVDEMRSGRE